MLHKPSKVPASPLDHVVEVKGSSSSSCGDSDDYQELATTDGPLLPNPNGRAEMPKWIDHHYISSLGHLHGLDSLRGIALVGPILDHISPMHPWNSMIGSQGVSIFFVLSGFLITGVLLNHVEVS